MFKRITLILLLLPCMVQAGNTDFEDFQKTQTLPDQHAFNQYLNDMQEAFQKIVSEEQALYEESILQHWDTIDVSQPAVWVEYGTNKQVKRKVDFEAEEIEITIITEETGAPLAVLLETELQDLLVENKQTAFKRDPVSSNVEKRLIQQAIPVKTAPISKKPVLGTLVFDTPQIVTPVVAKNKAAALLKSPKLKITKNKRGKTVKTVTIKLPKKPLHKKAQGVASHVTKYSLKQKISEPLIFAIIQTESAFNPMAKSPIPAYGLMQIVPKSAGLDVTQMLFGKARILSPSYLYNEEHNIKIGSAYLHILSYRYLKKIKNPTSRLYCTIAAYNTGAGNVAKAFINSKNISRAAVVINKLSPEKVYQTLLTKLPYTETRHYLRRVTKRMKHYQ